MDLTSIEPALAALLATLSGVEATCVVWENAPRPRYNSRLALLSWVSGVGVGVDETTWDYAVAVDPLAEMTPTVTGQRKVVLQVSVESLDQRPGYTARNTLEEVRTRLQSPSALAALKAVGLAFASSGNVTPADYRVDGRWLSRSVLDVRLNALSRITDTAGRTSYLATIGAVPTITRPDGAAVDPDIAPGGTLP